MQWIGSHADFRKLDGEVSCAERLFKAFLAARRMAVPPLNTSAIGRLSLGKCAELEKASRMAFTSDWITSS